MKLMSFNFQSQIKYSEYLFIKKKIIKNDNNYKDNKVIRVYTICISTIYTRFKL